MVNRFFTPLIFLLASAAAQADVVTLNNGDRLTGTVDSVSGGRVLLVTEYAGGVPIDLEAVASIVTDESFDIDVGERSFSGSFAYTDEQVVDEDGVTTPIDLKQISTAGQNKFELPMLGADWSSRADVSLIISNGNSDTESLNTLIESTLTSDDVEHFASLLVSQEEAEGVQTKDQLDVDYGYKRFLSEQWYASGNAEYFKDELKDIDERITAGAGMGYQFWDDSFGAFSTELGINAVYEKLDEDTESNPALRWGLKYNRFFFSKRMEFFHRQAVLFIPDSDRGEVISSSTGLRYALSDRIDAAARVDVAHETEPTPGNSKTDVTYTLGVGVKF